MCGYLCFQSLSSLVLLSGWPPTCVGTRVSSPYRALSYFQVGLPYVWVPVFPVLIEPCVTFRLASHMCGYPCFQSLSSLVLLSGWPPICVGTRVSSPYRACVLLSGWPPICVGTRVSSPYRALCYFQVGLPYVWVPVFPVLIEPCVTFRLASHMCGYPCFQSLSSLVLLSGWPPICVGTRVSSPYRALCYFQAGLPYVWVPVFPVLIGPCVTFRLASHMCGYPCFQSLSGLVLLSGWPPICVGTRVSSPYWALCYFQVGLPYVWVPVFPVLIGPCVTFRLASHMCGYPCFQSLLGLVLLSGWPPICVGTRVSSPYRALCYFQVGLPYVWVPVFPVLIGPCVTFRLASHMCGYPCFQSLSGLVLLSGWPPICVGTSVSSPYRALCYFQVGLPYVWVPVFPDRAQPWLWLQRLSRWSQEALRLGRRSEQKYRLPLHRHPSKPNYSIVYIFYKMLRNVATVLPNFTYSVRYFTFFSLCKGNLLILFQIVVEEFLEDINNILNSGEVPNLFEPDEYERLIIGCRPGAKEAGIPEGNRDAIYEFCINRVRWVTYFSENNMVSAYNVVVMHFL